MDLWIRTQDKTKLVKCNSINIPLQFCGDDFWFIDNDDNTKINVHRLGTYKSKERALEVLDEIQKYLTPTLSLLPEYNELEMKVYTLNSFQSFVYIMPQD